MQATAPTRDQTTLAARFVSGDPDAFEKLFRDHQAEVFGWIAPIVRDRGLAEDATIETFWRIYRARAHFDPAREFRAWAHRIAVHAAIDALKAARRASAPIREPAAAPQPISDPGVANAVRRAFGELPARLQAAAGLALIDERAIPDVAASLGISLPAAKSRVFRAIRLLRKKLRRLGIESP